MAARPQRKRKFERTVSHEATKSTKSEPSSEAEEASKSKDPDGSIFVLFVAS